MLMSLGMAAIVAPLTTTVMGAIEERHAGIASDINNAVARTAGLVSIAVLGIVMTGVFTRTFDAGLQSLSLPVEARTELMGQKNRLAAIAIPESLAGETRQAGALSKNPSSVIFASSYQLQRCSRSWERFLPGY